MPEWLECIAAIYDTRCVTSSCALRILLLLVNAQSGLIGGGTRDFYKRAAPQHPSSGSSCTGLVRLRQKKHEFCRVSDSARPDFVPARA